MMDYLIFLVLGCKVPLLLDRLVDSTLGTPSDEIPMRKLPYFLGFNPIQLPCPSDWILLKPKKALS